MWEGYQWRYKRENEDQENIMAYFTACQMSVHTKKPVSPKDLLKPLRPEIKKQSSKKEDEEHLKKAFGI